MSDVLVKVDDVSKKFSKSLKHSMVYSIQDIVLSMLGLTPKTEELRDGEFWSVENVSFELKRGECLGVIGPNGAGKSTLLKMLNGIISPDKGRIEIRGRVGALIEITAGFHPMLTGRENIYVAGSIHGLSKREIDRKFDDIVEFSELGDFIDTPVKYYSSGMNVRLGFAIAAQMEPDILLIDEVLAVGDVGFMIKCYNVIAKIIKKAAVILVSHHMPQVARICSDICVMDKGRSVFQGKDVAKGISHYFSLFDPRVGTVSGNGKAEIHKIEIESNGRKDIDELYFLDETYIHIYLTVSPEIKFPIINISLLNLDLQIIAQVNSLYNKIPIHNSGEPMHVRVNIGALQLSPGSYYLSAFVLDETQREILVQHFAVKKFKVGGEFIGLAPVQIVGNWDFKEEKLCHLPSDIHI